MKKCIITVFFLVDNFCKIFENWEKNNLLPSTKTRQRAGNLTLSELLSIVLFFYLSPCRDFKNSPYAKALFCRKIANSFLDAIFAATSNLYLMAK